MPSFDIASKLDAQLLDNAVNVAKKDILNRWDFKDSKSTIELNKKDLLINVSTENDMRLDAILDAGRLPDLAELEMEFATRTSPLNHVEIPAQNLDDYNLLLPFTCEERP